MRKLALALLVALILTIALPSLSMAQESLASSVPDAQARVVEIAESLISLNEELYWLSFNPDTIGAQVAYDLFMDIYEPPIKETPSFPVPLINNEQSTGERGISVEWTLVPDEMVLYANAPSEESLKIYLPSYELRCQSKSIDQDFSPAILLAGALNMDTSDIETVMRTNTIPVGRGYPLSSYPQKSLSGYSIIYSIESGANDDYIHSYIARRR